MNVEAQAGHPDGTPLITFTRGGSVIRDLDLENGGGGIIRQGSTQGPNEDEGGSEERLSVTEACE